MRYPLPNSTSIYLVRTLAPRDIPVSHSVVLGGALPIAGELGIPGPYKGYPDILSMSGLWRGDTRPNCLNNYIVSLNHVQKQLILVSDILCIV